MGPKTGHEMNHDKPVQEMSELSQGPGMSFLIYRLAKKGVEKRSSKGGLVQNINPEQQ